MTPTAGLVTVVVNPTSGKGKAARDAPAAVARLRQHGLAVNVHTSSGPDDLREATAKAVASGSSAVVACGGDGTVHLVAQELVGTHVALGIVASGTGDDTARVLELPRGKPTAAADVIAGGHRRTIDVGRAVTSDGNDRYFLAVLSSGFDSCVNERANAMTWPKGQARYLRGILAELASFRPLPFDVTVDDVVRSGEAMLVAVGNGPAYGGGMKVCPGARLDDGLLDVTFLGKVSRPTFLRVFPRVFSGRHVSHPSVTTYTGAHVRIDAPGQIAYADGERIGPLPVTIEVVPRALTILTPIPGGNHIV